MKSYKELMRYKQDKTYHEEIRALFESLEPEFLSAATLNVETLKLSIASKRLKDIALPADTVLVRLLDLLREFGYRPIPELCEHVIELHFSGLRIAVDLTQEYK